MASSDFPIKREKSNLLSNDETDNGFHQDGGKSWDKLETDQKNTLQMFLGEMKKLNEKFDKLSSDVSEMKAEVKKEVLDVQKEIGQLKKSGEMSERALSILFGKVNALGEETKERIGDERVKEGIKEKEEKWRVAQEMFAAQDKMAVQEKMRVDQEKMAAQRLREARAKMNEKRWLEERKSEMRVTKEMRKARTWNRVQAKDSVTESSLSNKLNKVKDKLEKMESSKKMTEDEIKEKMEVSNPQMTIFSLIHKYTHFEPSFVWTIGGVKDKMTLNTFSMTSERFNWTGYPVSARVQLELKEDDYVYLCLKFENLEEVKGLKPKPQVFYLLKGQDPSTSVCSQAKCNFYCPPCLDPFHFVGALGHRSNFTSQQFNVDDSVMIEVYVEPPSMVQKGHSYNGTLDWAIEEYSEKLEAIRKGLIPYESGPYFYTGLRGYRVQASMKLQWDKPAICISFVPGEFDSELPLTFRHRTTITLVNRRNPERSIIKTVETNVNNEYAVAMGSFDEVKKVVGNDTLFCRVIIKPIETKTTEK